MVVGLGNPGGSYKKTRHNVGFELIDALLNRWDGRLREESGLSACVGKLLVEAHHIVVAKPTVFMNKSGHSVSALLSYFKVDSEQLLVVHDDLDLQPGVARLKFDGGHGGQNGLRDIKDQLGHGRFFRLRLGIGHPGDKNKVTPWVLTRASRDDEENIGAAIGRVVDVFPLLVEGEMAEAMKRINTPS